MSNPSQEPVAQPRIVIIGAGPAGLTTAYQLSKERVVSTILEEDSVVGGISRTVERDGWRFDIGGHRFFTKVKDVDALWFEILGEDEFLQRPRLSRIFYNGKLYDYPLSARNALGNLGLLEAVKCGLSYVWVRIRRPKDTSTFEGFVASRFGWRLYRTFFKTYTEKVWGMPATEIQADWGAQRIKDLSLFRAGIDALTPKWIKQRKSKSKQTTSLIEEFNYPKYGPGQMWEKAAEIVTGAGSTLTFGASVTGIRHADGAANTIIASVNGDAMEFPCDEVVSSMPFGQLVKAMDPPAPAAVIAAADGLRYRDFITVALVVPESAGFADNWIYIHDPKVAVGRIQNFGSWSPYLIKEGKTCLGLEFFVTEGDDVWNMTDEDLIAQGTTELEILNLVEPGSVEAGYVVRMPKAYPIYDGAYKENVEVLRSWIAEHVPNVRPVGRNGMHRYNNQDHSMVTAMLTADNIAHGTTHDVWTVNVEQEYHEES